MQATTILSHNFFNHGLMHHIGAPYMLQNNFTFSTLTKCHHDQPNQIQAKLPTFFISIISL